MADNIRLRSILLIASEGELCVCELMAALDELSQPKVSRHLAVLKNSGLLITRKQKQWVFYNINPDIPPWIHQVIALTLSANIDFITSQQQALHAMGDRPSRIARCCD